MCVQANVWTGGEGDMQRGRKVWRNSNVNVLQCGTARQSS